MWNKTLDAYFFLLPDGCFRRLDDELQKQEAEFMAVGMTFRANIDSAITVASIPFLMADQASHRQRFHSLLTAERIRARIEVEDSSQPTPPHLEERAYSSASQRFKEEMDTQEGSAHRVDDVVRRLEEANRDDKFRRAALLLLAETLVMLWGSFEAFTSEVVKVLLNKNPSLAATLLSKDPAKKHFPKGIPVDLLAEKGFNVAGSMGDILLADIRLDSLPRIRDIFSSLIPSNHPVHSKLAASGLWILAQRRHLIVHKRAQIDAAYLAQTGEQKVIGSRLEILQSDVDEALLLITEVVVEILSSVRLITTGVEGQC